MHTARQDGIVTLPAQENLFLTRRLACDICWLLREERQKGLRADLPGKLDYLWRASNGNLLAQNDLFRLQHMLHAVKMTGWIYMVLAEGEWSGRRKLRLSPFVSSIYLNRNALDTGFDDLGRPRIPLPAQITGELAGLDVLLNRSGWRRVPAGEDGQMHHLLAEGFSAA
ncbi:UNVERIFIED_ORG: hypothetical protein C7430_11574 [Pantoea agglomerans]|uniref:Uncharacterized protein n=1 Tax=Enterobacter agglomerans TaxID=549 RepID=A0ABD6XK75_ENTAG